MLTPEALRLGPVFQFLARFSVGMQLFFIISGYLVTQSWERVSQLPHARIVFALKRAAKIYPLYLVFIGINIGLWLFLASNLQNAAPLRNFVTQANLNLPNVGAHLVFLQGFIPQFIHSLLDGSWSIANEVYFYILLPGILFPLAKDIRSAVWLYLATLAFSMFCAVYWPVITSWAPLNFMRSGSEGFGYYFFPNQLPCFVMGILLRHLLSLPGIENICRGYRHALWVGPLLIAFGMTNGNLWPLGYHHLYSMLLLAVMLSAFGWPAVKRNWLALWVTRIGRQSYALFFIHLILIKFFMAYWSIQGWSTESVWMIFSANLVIGLVGSLLLSELCFDRIDRWCVRSMNRHTNRLQDKIPQPVTA
jgi:peptidoglycan/LPS O-acetylase OafA/YrhL